MSSASSSPASHLQGTLVPQAWCSMLPLPDHESSASGSAIPDAVTVTFSRPVPWRVTGNDGQTTNFWSHLGRAAQHQACEWARQHRGIAKLGYLAGVSSQELDLAEDWNHFPCTETKVAPF